MDSDHDVRYGNKWYRWKGVTDTRGHEKHSICHDHMDAHCSYLMDWDYHVYSPQTAWHEPLQSQWLVTGLMHTLVRREIQPLPNFDPGLKCHVRFLIASAKISSHRLSHCVL